MSADLVAFLAARMDDDERYLRQLTVIGERKRDSMTDADFAANLPGIAELMADPELLAIQSWWVPLGVLPPNDTRRLLREIEAKRAVLADYESAKARYDSQVTMRDLAEDRHLAGAVFGLKQAVMTLVAAYSGHPDYQPEWAP